MSDQPQGEGWWLASDGKYWKVVTSKSDALEGTTCAIEEVNYSIFD